MKPETDLALVEELLGGWRVAIGEQYAPYRNHVYRVLNFCFALHACDEEAREKLMIAACFHDLGIWPDDTVDYLGPSVQLARACLEARDRGDWSVEISQMIDEHHRFRAVRNGVSPLVEVFRKADWVDVTLGMRWFGLSRPFVKEVLQTFPNLGFHRNLLRLTKEEFLRHPFRPLPMMKW